MTTVRVYDPTAASSVRGSALAPRLTDLRGKVVGVLDNGKANAGVLMTTVAEELKSRHGVRDLVLRTKPVAGPASPETVRVLKEQTDFVLVGSADWGSCTAWSIQAAIVLEKEGIPTVVVGTDEFQSLGTLESKARGMPDLRFAITKHPIGGLKPDQVRAKASAMIEATLQAVTEPAAAGHAAS